MFKFTAALALCLGVTVSTAHANCSYHLFSRSACGRIRPRRRASGGWMDMMGLPPTPSVMQV